MSPDKQKQLTRLAVIGGVGIILLLIILFSSTITIEAGYRGIVFRPFAGGIDKENIYEPGFHVVAPWNDMITYDVRLQSQKSTMAVLSRDGADIKLDLSYRFRPVSKQLPILHERIGKDYAQTVIMPEIRSSAREVVGKYQPEELYSSKRGVIQTEIFDMTSKALKSKDLLLDKILIREIKLPENISAAIERKLEQEQLALEYEFKLDRERKEADRKAIEAKGIARQMEIIAQGLSNRFLKYKGIEATRELSNSKNSKVVVIGQGKDGLPIILGGDN